MEKTVTKCLCKVLDGLSQNDLIHLPDSVEIIFERAKQSEHLNKKPVNEFSALIQEMVNASKKEREEHEDVKISDESESE